jgi:hypothetical protein
MPRFRLDFLDDETSLDVEADDFDDDGQQVTLYRYPESGSDPLDTEKEVIASFDRSSLVGPPRPVI